MRNLTLLCAAALTAALVSPAHAATEEVFSGTVSVDCFGCGQSDATADITFAVGRQASARLTVTTLPDSICVTEWVASGTISGAIDGTISLHAIADALTVTVTDEHGRSYAGAAAFAVTGPIGLYCGQSVSATVAGTLVAV